MMGVLEDASFPLKHIFKNLNLAHWLPPDDLRESIFFLASWIGYASAHLLPLYFHVFKIFLILDIWIYLFFWSFLLNCFFILLPTSNPVVTLLRFFFLLRKTSLVEFVQRSFLLMCPWRPSASVHGRRSFYCLLFIFSILFLMPNEVCTLSLYRLMKLLGTSNHHCYFAHIHLFSSFLDIDVGILT